MPANIRIVHAHDFLKATAEARLDLEASKKLLIEVAAASATLPDYHIILDTRKAQSGMSVTDLWYLAAELSKDFRKASRTPKMAVLCPLERFNHAEFFALCAHNRGFRVSAFTSFEEAYEWLVSSQDA